MNIVWDVVVIGGGPAGMMAAGRAAECGKKVLLLEKNVSLGKKLLITGGGRCNVTNNKPDVRAMLAKYKEGGKFLASPFTQFGVKETIEFFRARGMEMKEENEGRMFPITNSAQTVWDVLVAYMKKGGVVVRTSTEVKGIRNEGGVFVIATGKGDVHARACVVATGGTSRPETGSTGEGFRWLKKLGHTIHESDASLVPIALKDSWVKKVAGVTLQDIKLTVLKNGVKEAVHKGKLLFTHVGISGPTVLNMSREVGELLDGEGDEYMPQKAEVTIMLDMFPTMDVGSLRTKLQAHLVEHSNKKLKNVLSAFVPPALVDTVLMLAQIDGETPNHSVRTEERKRLVSVLKAIPLHVKGLLGKDKAVVSSGGVDLREVDFKTMQSNRITGLFLVGDVLNIDRPSGGYSLQLCWTTGYVAGSNC
jgi:predicted Rossmann fold flavoprotein